MKRSLIAFILMMLLLVACQRGPLALFDPTPTLFPESFIGKAKIGDYELQISCEGSGEPTIILERGLYDFLWGWTASDTSRFKKIARTCFYKRAGISEIKKPFPRTVMDQVKDLHELLRQTGVPGPYILVSNAETSSIPIVYTNQYPQDVAGLVAVNPRYPTFYEDCLDRWGPVTADTSPRKKEAINMIQTYVDKTGHQWNIVPEYLDQQSSDALVMEVTTLKDIPLIIVETGFTTNYWPADVNQDMDDAIKKANKDFCKLSSRCQMVKAPDTDEENITRSSVVDKAIQEMYDMVEK